ncbi:3-oxoacyl-[acyl-carrier protein] reductase [Minicystis rosea]|nr:3-oxoacyl-[acyl-carrier protein] reductase [Minicystis rosea]
MGELVLITGTSSGIGLSAAIECAAAGHDVVATMRHLDRRKALEEAAKARGVTVAVEQLDVTSPGVGAKVRELILKYGPFYALVNNAGIAVGGAFEEQSENEVREQFETNVFGLMAVTRAVLPSMRATQRGRIINVSSLSGRVAFPLLSAYAATKHAVEGFSESLRWELEPFGIDVCLVEPGTFKTPVFVSKDRRAAGTVADGSYRALNEAMERLLTEEAGKERPPDQAGPAIARLVAEPSPRFRTLVGIDARTLVTLRRMVPDRLFASGIRRLMQLPRSR